MYYTDFLIFVMCSASRCRFSMEDWFIGFSFIVKSKKYNIVGDLL